jgi:hypothetical protein
LRQVVIGTKGTTAPRVGAVEVAGGELNDERIIAKRSRWLRHFGAKPWNGAGRKSQLFPISQGKKLVGRRLSFLFC